MFVESIKKGIDNAVRNWPAVLVQMGAMFIYGMGFVIMVLFPLLIVIGAVSGMNIQGLENIASGHENIGDLIVNNVLAVLVTLITITLYILVISTLAFYIFAGLLGVVGKASADPSYKFGFTSFLQEGRRLFWRVMWLVFLLSLVFLVVFAAIGVMGLLGYMALSPYYSSESLAAKFLAIFITLLALSGALLVFVLFIAWSSYALVAMVSRDLKAVAAFREGFDFMKREPRSLAVFLGAGGLYLMASLSVTLMVFPISLIPIIGLFLSIPAQVISYGVDRFLSLAVMGTLFHFYAEMNRPAGGEAVETVDSGGPDQESDNPLPA